MEMEIWGWVGVSGRLFFKRVGCVECIGLMEFGDKI